MPRKVCKTHELLKRGIRASDRQIMKCDVQPGNNDGFTTVSNAIKGTIPPET